MKKTIKTTETVEKLVTSCDFCDKVVYNEFHCFSCRKDLCEDCVKSAETEYDHEFMLQSSFCQHCWEIYNIESYVILINLFV